MLDTNVLVSALLWTGPPHELLRMARTGAARVLASPTIVEELRGVLARPKLAARITELETSVGELLESLLHRLTLVEEAGIETVVPDDPDDDHVVACAVAGRARWIVSGDRHLLGLMRYKRIAILRPAEALARLYRGSRSRGGAKKPWRPYSRGGIPRSR